MKDEDGAKFSLLEKVAITIIAATIIVVSIISSAFIAVTLFAVGVKLCKFFFPWIFDWYNFILSL